MVEHGSVMKKICRLPLNASVSTIRTDRRHWLHLRLTPLLSLIFSFFLWAQAQDNEPCLECHDDIPDHLYKTPHLPSLGVSCISCHPTEEEHLDEPEPENTSIPAGAEGAKICVSCHAGGVPHAVQEKNLHARSGVFCSDCHTPHQSPRPIRHILKQETDSLCISCHDEQGMMDTRPFGHLKKGLFSCTSCHSPHEDRKQLFTSMDTQAICGQCHEDKQGPFVFEHVTGIHGDCLSCHQPHGSSNPRQLTRAHVSQLCLECHSLSPQELLGSQPPAFHNLRSPRYRDCTVCHTAVHGSNGSPALLK